MIDVLGIGCCAVDDVVYVPAYPAADSKMRVSRRERRCGGLTAIALMTATQLGAKCEFAGVLGHDELSHFALRSLRECGVGTKHSVFRPGAGPVHSNIIVDETNGGRTILYDPSQAIVADEELPPAELIASARVLAIDHYGTRGMIRAARIAREVAIPVVADLEDDTSPDFSMLLAEVDHLVLSSDFARKITGASDPASAARALWTGHRSAVVITAGGRGCWYIDESDSGTIAQCPAYSVSVVDTTGCGDVFHGAYAAALAKGMPIRERLTMASAAAALKASNQCGKLGVPCLKDVKQMIQGSLAGASV